MVSWQDLNAFEQDILATMLVAIRNRKDASDDGWATSNSGNNQSSKPNGWYDEDEDLPF